MFLLAYHLVFAPQQIKASTVDGRAEEVQAVVCNTEIQVTKPEHRPVKERWSIFLPATELENITMCDVCIPLLTCGPGYVGCWRCQSPVSLGCTQTHQRGAKRSSYVLLGDS